MRKVFLKFKDAEVQRQAIIETDFSSFVINFIKIITITLLSRKIIIEMLQTKKGNIWH